ncbi:serine/threonine protein kinase [Pendulispora rubella]|uniref:Serine/threonine protein kinase n=1 Tax=Pendulispora rubella TaxID=2741070 RepID=A0ABZ2L7J7_9BACT
MSTNTAEDAPEVVEERRSFSLGKYYLFARLGSGGMADAYLAVARGALNINKLAVVKRLREEHASDPDAREMFLNEARLAARLNHPNVIQTFEAGSEGGCYFIAMEYVDGQPLSRISRRLKRKGRRIDPTIGARICSNALEGLHHAHELADFDGTPLRMVHRDVSPQNIMVTYDGRVKVLDFGIAKAVGTSQTAHGIFKGKLAFMAPEQLVGDKVDHRADLFSMGICLWEAATGESLLADETPAKTLFNLMNKSLPLASDVNSEVPEQLAAIIAKALERNPDDRYASAHEMHMALEEFIRSQRLVTEHDVGGLPRQLFGDTRERLQAETRDYVARLSLRSEGDFLESQIRNLGSALLLDFSDLAEQEGTRTNRVTLRATTASLDGPAPRKPMSVRRGVAIAVATMLGCGVSFAVFLATGAAIWRSHHAAPTRLAEAPATIPVVARVPEPVLEVHPMPPTHPAPTASAPPPKSVPVAPPAVKPPPAPRATSSVSPTASAVPLPADSVGLPPQPTSTASAPSASPAQPPPRGRVFRREL